MGCLLAMAEQQVESRVAANSRDTWRRLPPTHTEQRLACNHYGVVSAAMISQYQAQVCGALQDAVVPA